MKTAWVLAAMLAPWRASAADDVMVRVNGVPLLRSAVQERAFRDFGTAAINQMADEILLGQAAKDLKVKPDEKEVAARLKRIQGQFPDEATFKARLAQSGSSLEALRAQLSEQVLREQLVVKAKGLGVAEEEVKQFFEANKLRLGQPEAVRLRHILVAGEKEAGDFLVAIRAGADFAKLASSVSLDNATKERGGELGLIARGMLQPELEKTVFALKAGEVGGPVKTALGFHLLKAEETRPAKPAAFADVKADIQAALWAEKVNKAWPDYLRELREKARYEPVRDIRVAP